MKKQILSLLFLLAGAGLFAQPAHDVLRLGTKDGSCAEFNALKGSYRHYPELCPAACTFCLDGKNSAKGIPFVIPGPADSWAGQPKGTLAVAFALSSFDKAADLELKLDFVETHPSAVPVLEISLNDFHCTRQVPSGRDQNFLDHVKPTDRNLGISVTIPASSLKLGDNMLVIRDISGSWVVLDDISLTCTSEVKKATPKGGLAILSPVSYPALVYGKTKDELLIPVNMVAVNCGNRAQNVPWECCGKRGEFRVEPGVNEIEVRIPESAEGRTVQLNVGSGKTAASYSVAVQPVERWTVYMVQHTHTDIGYTKPQTEILTEHLRYIDYAVEYCEATEDYPDNAKFRWVCESSWAVSQWLKMRPQSAVDKFVKYVKNGQIEVTAMYFNMSELSGENSYRYFFEPIRKFKELGIMPTTAMQNDVNGLAWCLADFLPELGVKYVTMGSNSHRAKIPFDRPTLYWWESPSGSRLLSYRNDHYHTGNRLGMTSASLSSLENGIFPYLSGLRGRGYNIPLVAVQYSGYVTDNSPPSVQRSDLVREWDEKYAWPKIRCATMGEFMAAVEKDYSGNLPVYRAAYPDWWTDGFGSAARETAASRTTQADMTAVTAAMAMARLGGEKKVSDKGGDIFRIYEDLLFYDEHTFGSSMSIRDPMCDNSQVQWAEKGSYVWDGLKNAKLLSEDALGSVQTLLYRTSAPTISFINPTGQARTCPVEVYIDFEVIPNGADFKFVGEDGRELYAQRVRGRSEGAYYVIWAEDIPAMGYSTYRIVLEGDRNAIASRGTIPVTGEYENDWYKLTLNVAKGGIVSLMDKQLGLELLDGKNEWPLGDVVYESLLNDRRQMERYAFEKYSRTGLKNLHVTSVQDGDVFKSINLVGDLDGIDDGSHVYMEIRMFNKARLISINYSLRRRNEREPSGIYVAFPFALEGGRTVFDVAGGQMTPITGQLPNSTTPWNTVQNYLSVRNDAAQVLVSCPQVPLFMVGGLMDNPYGEPDVNRGTDCYSWVMNNYWTTNFRAFQEGEHKWEYFITSMEGNANSDAVNFGWGSRIPLLARVMPASIADNGKPMRASLMSVDNPDVFLFSASVIDDGSGDILVGVRETNGGTTAMHLIGADGKAMSFVRTDLLGAPLKGASSVSEIELKPFESAFLRIKL